MVRGYKLDIFLGNGDGTFLNFVELPIPGPSGAYIQGADLVAGDFNGDGRLDLVVENNYGEVYLLTGKGDGTFRYPAKALSPFPPSTCDLIAVTDLNADGKLDFLMGCVGYELAVLIGGDGTFQQPVKYPLAPEPSIVAIGDFNSDGNTDILVAAPGATDYLSIFRGNGDGSFQPPQLVPVVDNFVGEGGMYTGDFNRDSLLDFLAVDAYYEGFMYTQQQ